MNKATYYQRCVITMVFFSWPSIQAAGYLMHQMPRNKEKLWAYQQEYAQQKQAPRHRKVSRAECALLEEKHVQRHNLLTAAEDLLPCSKAAIGLCIYPSFCHLVLTQTSSGYKCLLIVHSRAACQGSKYYGSTRHRRGRLHPPSWIMTLGSWRHSRRGAGTAA